MTTFRIILSENSRRNCQARSILGPTVCALRYRISKFLVKMPLSQLPSEDDLLSEIIDAKQKAAAERLLPTLPAQYLDPMQLTMQLFMQRRSWDEQLADKSKINVQIRQTYLGQETHYSSTPLDKLKPSKYERSSS
jgi:hypothetical protein